LGGLGGLASASRRWLVTAPTALVSSRSWAEVVDPGPAVAHVWLQAEGAGSAHTVPGTSVVLSAGQRAAIAVPAAGAARALVLDASAPVMTEVDSYSLSSRSGTDLSPAVALASP
jgi:hypothetical protein